MNKPIFDLLDAYEDDSVEPADAAPLSSARIKELTMNKIADKTNKRTLRRAPLRILAAAAAAAALVFSAVAANVWGAGDFMKDMFAAWNEEPLTATQVEILNSMGYVFDGSDTYSVTSNGATITPISAMADEDSCYLHLRVEAPEGVVLPDLEEYTCYALLPFAKLELENLEPETGDRMVERCIALPDNDPTDNVKDIVLWLTGIQGGKSLGFNDGSPKWLTIRGLGIISWSDTRDPIETELFRGEFRFDIGAHFESQVAAIDCGGALWADPETGEANYMDTMKLSPLGLGFYFRTNLRWDNGRRRPQVPGDVRVVMKDGSELFVSHCCAYVIDEDHPDHSDPYYQIGPDLLTQEAEWSTFEYYAFETPLDLSQVDYVQFGEDYIYPITMG